MSVFFFFCSFRRFFVSVASRGREEGEESLEVSCSEL